MAEGLAGRTVYVVKSGGCADRDFVYGVYSTDAIAQEKRLLVMSVWARDGWPDSVEVQPFEIDAPALEEGQHS